MSEYEKLVEILRSYSTEMLSYKIDGAFAYAVTAAADAIEQLSTKCRRLEKERDAAVSDLKGLHNALDDGCCYACKNDIFDYDKSVCAGCALQDNWEWRGVQEDNDERTE